MALRKVKANLDRVLDKNLQDIVRGIRNHKDDEAKYIAACLDEIKQELKHESVTIKTNAVMKLTFLQMMGYDASWAAFNVIEVMSSLKFTQKRTGYLAASQTFHQGTDVLMLTTNMIRKDLVSSGMYEAGSALTGLSCFITPDLAQDLANDIMSLMSSTRPYLRKKAVLLMYKVYLNYPDALRPSFPRLKDKLEDPDPGVQSAAVNVICELARKNPKNYLSLAPVFFKLMTTSTNNWMLIKIIKLFAALTPLEPRLGKKLIEPLTNLINSTTAMSLLYECINTVIAVLVSISSDLPNHASSIQLCVQKLRVLIEDSDQNLKYLGLLAMSKILKTHPKSVQAHKDLVLQCLDDRDESIRVRALNLLYGMVSRKNLMEIVKKLMIHMDKAEGSTYRDELLAKIIEICSQNNYQFVVNFEWYISILVELTKAKTTQHGGLLSSQMMDVAIRVQAIRAFTVSQMAILLENLHILTVNAQKNGICEILHAAAWICGEFSEHLNSPLATLRAMLNPKVVSLPGHIQSVFVQNALKLYSSLMARAEEACADDGKVEIGVDGKAQRSEVNQLLMDKLPLFVQSADLEVQDRACSGLQLMKYITKAQDKGVPMGEEVKLLFKGELNPVAPKAQKKVPVPEGLDLDKWINEPPPESSDEDDKVPAALREAAQVPFYEEDRKSGGSSKGKKKTTGPSEEEIEKKRKIRVEEQAANPFYIKASIKGGSAADLESVGTDIDVEDIPVEQLDLDTDLQIQPAAGRLLGLASSDKYYREGMASSTSTKKRKKDKKKKKKKRKRGDPVSEEEEEEDIQPVHKVSAAIDMPEGMSAGESEDERDLTDAHRMLDINLDEPLRADEKLPVQTHRMAAPLPEPTNGARGDNNEGTREKSKKKKKQKDREGKKEKKTKKRSKDADHPENASAEGDLLVGLDPMSSTSGAQGQRDNLESSVAPSPAVAESPLIQANGITENGASSDLPADSDLPKGKKKEKKEKKDKKRKKKRESTESGLVQEGEVESNAGDQSSVQELPPLDLSHLSTYRHLAQNECISLEYDTQVTPQPQGTFVAVRMILANKTTHNIKDLDVNVLDSLNAKLMRDRPGDPIKIPFVLMANLRNEFQLEFSVQSLAMPQKLKGTLTYIIMTDAGATQEKLDFRLTVLCRDFLVPTPMDGPDFTKLLSGGELTSKHSVKVESQNDFRMTLARLQHLGRMSVVERGDLAASLYSRSSQGHHVCLLMKQLGNGVISIDGKSSDPNFISNVVDEVKDLI